MLLFLLRRLGAGLVLLFFLSSLTFFLLNLTGQDPARSVAGQNASVEQVETLRQQLGLDQPVFQRYLEWLGAAVHGDLGTSWFTSQPVTLLLGQALPVTLSMVGLSIVLTAVVSVVVGVVAGVRGGWVDRGLQGSATVFFAIPNFIIALFLALIFAVTLGWFPAVGYVPFQESPIGWLESITLPAVSLALGAIAIVSLQLRGSMVDVQQADFMRTVRSRGTPRRSLLFRHSLRNAAPSAVTVLAIMFVVQVSGSVVVEQVFNLPGIGTLANTAASQGDLPLVEGVVVVTVATVVIVNLLLDVAQGWLNPKVRVS